MIPILVQGKWSGYRIQFEYQHNEYELETDIGVRSIDIPVTIIIKNKRFVSAWKHDHPFSRGLHEKISLKKIRVLPKKIDRSDKADAERFRWLLDGNGYFMQEEYLCGHDPVSDKEKDKAREKIDKVMKRGYR